MLIIVAAAVVGILIGALIENWLALVPAFFAGALLVALLGKLGRQRPFSQLYYNAFLYVTLAAVITQMFRR